MMLGTAGMEEPVATDPFRLVAVLQDVNVVAHWECWAQGSASAD